MTTTDSPFFKDTTKTTKHYIITPTERIATYWINRLQLPRDNLIIIAPVSQTRMRGIELKGQEVTIIQGANYHYPESRLTSHEARAWRELKVIINDRMKLQ